MSPTQRSLALLRKMGYLCAVVEKFVRFPPPGHRVDLWGFVDILAIHPGLPVLAVQVTTSAHAPERVKKIRASENFETVITSNIKVVVHGWRKGGPRGKRKTWACTETAVDHAVTP